MKYIVFVAIPIMALYPCFWLCFNFLPASPFAEWWALPLAITVLASWLLSFPVASFFYDLINMAETK